MVALLPGGSVLIVENYTWAVSLCTLSMLCWGSWANMQQAVKKDWSFSLFYWDFPIGLVLLSLLVGLTLGGGGQTADGFWQTLRQASTASLCQALLSGVIFNLSNILLVAAIALAGMAVAFPVAVGLALVLGVLINFLATPGAHAGLLLSGVAAVTLAIIFTGLAYSRVQTKSNTVKKGLAVAIAAGLLMGFFYRFLAAAIGTDTGSLTIYSANFVFSVAVLISNFAFNTWMMKRPLQGKPIAARAYFAKGAPHWAGIIGGVIWSIGLTGSLMASHAAGYAISYGLSQGATLVAALWGVFVWKEFKHAHHSSTRWLIAGMFVFYILGLVLIILSR